MCKRISPRTALDLVASNSPVLVWDSEDDDGTPFCVIFGYVMGMGITRENGDLVLYVYSPEYGNCIPYKKGVEVQVGFLPEVFAKVGERFRVGKIISIDRSIKLAHLLTDDGDRYEVPLSNIVCADNVKLGLEVISTDEAKEPVNNEV